MNKKCVTCHIVRDLTEFNKNARSKDGHQDRCRPCYKEWYQNNKETHKETVKKNKSMGYDPIRCNCCEEVFYRSPGRRDQKCRTCKRMDVAQKCPECDRFMSVRATTCRNCRPQAGEDNPGWKGGISRHHNGYVQVRVGGKYVMEHRVVMEDHLGRDLETHENVHHVNGIKCDNRIENLELWAKPQPSGARATDLLEWAERIVATYRPLADQGLI